MNEIHYLDKTSMESIECFINDKNSPIIILFGHSYSGKTFALLRLAKYLKNNGYIVSPDSVFRSKDSHYYRQCSEFLKLYTYLYSYGTCPPEISYGGYILFKVINSLGLTVCQILDIPGEHCFNFYKSSQKPEKPEIPAYLNTIIESPNRKIWVFFVEHGWGEDQVERNLYAQKICSMQGLISPNDKVVFLFNKVDRQRSQYDKTGKPRKDLFFNQIKREYPRIFSCYKNSGLRKLLFGEYNFETVCFSSGEFSKNEEGHEIWIPESDWYCSELWKAIQKSMLQKKQHTQDNIASHGLSLFVNKMMCINNKICYNRIMALPKGQIAIARNFGFVLNDDGHLTLFGKNEKFHQIISPYRIIKVAAAFDGYMILTESGRILTGGSAREFERYNDIEQLSNVIDVVSCEGHTVALFKDGTVKSIDEPGGWEGVPDHNRIVQNWRGIRQIAVGYNNIMGLTEDGRVIYHSNDRFTNCYYYDNIDDAIQIDCYSHYYGTDSSMVLRKNGTVISDTFKGVDKWKNIVQISVGADIAIGLKANGTLEVADIRRSRMEITKWRNLISVECKFFGVIGITRKGEVLSFFA